MEPFIPQVGSSTIDPPPVLPHILTNGPAPVPKGRLRVVDEVSYQGADDEPRSVVCRFGRWAETGEQPCLRRVTIDGHLRHLDEFKLWIDIAGMLVIENTTPTLQTIPTPAKTAENESRVIELWVRPLDPTIAAVLVCPIPVGESVRLPGPILLANIGIRCRAGSTRALIAAFPM